MESNVPYCAHSVEERSLTGTWTTMELQLALENGYEILDIHEIWNWGENKTKKLFRDYMMNWMILKLKNSPISENTDLNDYVKSLNEEYGLELEPEDIVSNPAMRSLGKLGLNSFWVCQKKIQKNCYIYMDFFNF